MLLQRVLNRKRVFSAVEQLVAHHFHMIIWLQPVYHARRVEGVGILQGNTGITISHMQHDSSTLFALYVEQYHKDMVRTIFRLELV